MTEKAINPLELRNVLGQFATGVTVVTTRDASGNKVGMTASSFNSLSLDPPLILWSIDKKTGCFDAFNECESFAVHVLSEDQVALSSLFAKRGVDKFAGLECQTGSAGTPLLTEYCARFECALEHKHDGGDHVIIIGRVIDLARQEKAPLIFHQGRYATLQPTLAS